jgi:hypothetical protein
VAVLREAIPHGRVFLNTFVKKHIPKLTAKLKRNQDAVMNVVNVVQKATRQLQTLVSHGKSKKDATILAATPALRR